MCKANAYIIHGGQKVLGMEAVDKIESEDDGLRVVNVFGDQKFAHARIYALSLVNHQVFLKE
jgi:predicted RNA-binding protein